MGLHHGQANFVTYGKPSLFLDFANKKSLTDRISGNNLITFTRSSTGTYVGADGLIKYAGADEARFDHDSSTGESLGLLIEESRTNLITYSEDFSQSVWAKQNGFSITSNTAIAPDGTLTADTASRVNLNAEYLYQNLNTPAGTYTLSCWIKSVNASSSFSIASYSGADGYQPSSFTATNTWERFSHTVTVSNPVTGFYPCIPSVSGEQFYIWGAQVEAGSFPTSHIPTSGSTATRALEYGYGTNMDFYNQKVGSVVSEIKLLDYGSTIGKVIWSLNQAGGFGEGIYFVNENGSNNIAYSVQNSGSQFSGGGFNSNNFIKSAIGLKENSMINYFNGSLVGSEDTSGTIPNNIGRLVIGNNAWGSAAFGGSNGLNPSNGHIKSFTYYPKRLTNAQLQTLTQ